MGTLEGYAFDFNYSAISDQYPASTPGSYSVQAGDTLERIASLVFGDASLWYLIADANGLSGTEALPQGLTLKIPNAVFNVHNNNQTFKPYNPGDIIGDTTPTLEYVPLRRNMAAARWASC